MQNLEKEYELRLKAFIDSKIHAITVVRAGDSYSWGYKDAMEEVLTYVTDMIKTSEMLSKPSRPLC